MMKETLTQLRLTVTGEYDLDATLAMGQAFCWRKQEKWHCGTIAGTPIRARMEGNTLIAEGDVSEPVLSESARRYFDTDCDLPTIQRLCAVDAHVAEAVVHHRGLRMLRQPLWECLAGFILSTVNNVPRITLIVRRLSEQFGEAAQIGGTAWRAFPSPERLADADLRTLYECGTGFRAKGLHEAARAFAEGRLSETKLRSLPYEQAHKQLTALHGVGEKVADCVALYALDQFSVVPLDVWMLRVMETLYFDGRKTPRSEIREFARHHFGKWGGYAQLYLFHHARSQSRNVLRDARHRRG